MNLRVIAIFLILFNQTVSGENLKWESHIRDDGVAVVVASREGYESLSEAVGSIPKDSWIKHVRVSFLSQYTEFQAELHSSMLTNYPAELETALASAGNMHNPKVIALRRAFTEAVLSSNYVKSVNAAFSKRCEKISSASFEKFFISKESGKPEYEAMLWLTTEKCT
ncbi:hypothetical protein O0V09_18850 [Dasania sp. GY-19]|uniref:Uncharacterized protein n=1 Tax=Dasania phycosphaerae TaxID=2950436 RepID=A0A9J6RT52_9GAMM|nr:hypothetical protein [Dasania phycosphaerae]MCZ0867261.1 hypothetical protein [Dasania phycosphaerae]